MDFAGIGIVIPVACFLVGAVAFLLIFFFAVEDEVCFELGTAVFFFEGMPIGMFMGIFDFEESRAAGGDCWARAGTVAKREIRTSAAVWRSDSEDIVLPKV